MKIAGYIFSVGCAALVVSCAGPRTVPGEYNPADLSARVRELYDTLSFKDCRHYDSKKRLLPFFRSVDDANAYIIRLAWELEQEGIVNCRIKKWEIISLEEGESVGAGKVKATGDGFLFFNASAERIDKWIKADGVWYLDPPPLENLSYK